jgi:uncharacterized protein DUF4383
MPSRPHPLDDAVDASTRRAARVVALCFGAVAVAGFVPGLTEHVERLQPAGWGSGALLFGVVRVSVVANLIHVVMAGAGLLAAQSGAASRRYLLWGGAAYAALSCHRLLVDHLVNGGRVPGQGPGEWLPVAAGLAMVVTGLLTAGPSTQPSR